MHDHDHDEQVDHDLSISLLTADGRHDGRHGT